ncbi:LLM class flavin-dependent oxidoreductase [Sinorhizobium fredii]|uniref:LLM class flavin-dependent oxidoreductase n=1 Tax=Rhizobium fredii TaxID=380 RepID=UPI0004B09D04|nr:LLM class flavin-dependent oxidoreductase [Sinorhizobium fredii]
MTALSILDLIMIGEEKSLVHSLDEALQFARRAEAAGYSRYWVAEHHNMPGIGSAATTIIMSHLATGTSSIRIGSGGIMLPNHAPLIVAEQFATLETLYPGRIDLGVGRAPGSDRETVLAIRGQHPAPREFSDDVTAVMNYLEDNRRQPARGIPGIHDTPVWILGSGLYGAKLAAELGLPFAFASHFAPRYLMQAITAYREHFRPSPQLAAPYVMVGVCVFAAESRQEAEYVASSHRQWVANLHAGRPGLLPKPVEGYMEQLSASQRIGLDQELACSVTGTRDIVRRWLQDFAEGTSADELMIDSRIYDPEARCRSYEIAAEAFL